MFNVKSGKELAKAKSANPAEADLHQKADGGREKRPVVGFGKGTAKYWDGKVYQPLWRDDDGQLRQVSNYFVRLMVSGRRVSPR